MDKIERPNRVLADSNVLIAGILKPRWFFEFLGHAIRGDFVLVLAPQTIAELHKWIEKKGQQQKAVYQFFLGVSNFEVAPDVTREEVEAQLHLVRDVTDVPVALSAIKAKVDYLVTNDQDFHTAETKAELQKHGVKVMLVGAFLAQVMNWQSHALEAIRQREWNEFLLL